MMDAEAIWTGRDIEQRQKQAAFEAMVARRERFDRLVAAEPKRPSKRRLAQLWRAAAGT